MLKTCLTSHSWRVQPSIQLAEMMMIQSQAYRSKHLFSLDLELADICLQASSKQVLWTSERTTLNINGAVVQQCGMYYQPFPNTKRAPPLSTGHQMAIKYPSTRHITLVKLMWINSDLQCQLFLNWFGCASSACFL